MMSEDRYAKHNVTNPFAQTTHQTGIQASGYRNQFDDNSAVMYDNGQGSAARNVVDASQYNYTLQNPSNEVN